MPAGGCGWRWSCSTVARCANTSWPVAASDSKRPLTDRGVPGEVWAVIARGLEEEPRKRWPTVEAFGRALWSALIHLRASLSEQGLPEDHWNPAGADGEAMGSSARRAYQPALTPALEPLPTSASGSVRLRSDLRAMATTTTTATLPRRGTPTARVARDPAPLRAGIPGTGPPRWLLVVMGCSAMLCLVILGYSLRGSSRAPVAVPKARRSAPSPSGAGLRPIFELPAEETKKNVF